MKLVQVLKTEAQKDPLILFIRNVEKSILGNFERYIKLETLKDVRLVVIGSHTSDQQKEKVRNILCPLILDICKSNLVEVMKFDSAKYDLHNSFFICSKLFCSWRFLDLGYCIYYIWKPSTSMMLQGNSGSPTSTKVGNNVTALLDLSFLVSFVNVVPMIIMRLFILIDS
jgi:hypothetical protein